MAYVNDALSENIIPSLHVQQRKCSHQHTFYLRTTRKVFSTLHFLFAYSKANVLTLHFLFTYNKENVLNMTFSLHVQQRKCSQHYIFCLRTARKMFSTLHFPFTYSKENVLNITFSVHVQQGKCSQHYIFH